MNINGIEYLESEVVEVGQGKEKETLKLLVSYEGGILSQKQNGEVVPCKIVKTIGNYALVNFNGKTLGCGVVGQNWGRIFADSFESVHYFADGSVGVELASEKANESEFYKMYANGKQEKIASKEKYEKLVEEDKKAKGKQPLDEE